MKTIDDHKVCKYERAVAKSVGASASGLCRAKRLRFETRLTRNRLSLPLIYFVLYDFAT